MNNLYPKYLIDESSGIEYLNPRYVAWREDMKQFVAWIESHPLMQISGTAVAGYGFYQIEQGEIKELFKAGGVK